MNFEARKQAVLQALAEEQRDKSKKGGIDAPIASLIERINKHPCFFTTSSCSGRVSVFLDPLDKGKKKGGEWVYVSHEPANVRQVVDSVTDNYLSRGLQGLLVFKYEPFILALECSSPAAGQQLVACAIASGFRESGITSLGKRVIVAVRCSIRLEVPIARAGQLLVSEEYLRVLTEMANEKMEMNRNRTDKFINMFVDQLQQRSLLQLETRQARLMSRLHAFETRLLTKGLIPVAEGMRSRDCVAGSEVARDSHDQHQCTGEGDDHTPQRAETTSRLGSPSPSRQLSCNGPLVTRKSNADASKEPRATGVSGLAISDGCSLLATSLMVSGEPVEKLHRWSHSASALSKSSKDGAVIIFGGYGGPGRHARLNDVLLLDLDTASLRTVNADKAPSARQAHSCVLIQDKMVVIGGREGPLKPLNDVCVFSTTSQSWSFVATSGATFPPRHRHAAVAIGSQIYVFGGTSGSEVYNDLHVLDTDLWHWRRLSCQGEIPCARHSHSTAAVEETVYLFGGRDEKCIYGDLYALEVRLLHWTKVETTGNCPVPRFSHSMTLCGDFLVVLGGCPITKTSKEIFLLHLKLLTWRSVTMCLPSNSLPVRHSVCAVKNRLLVIGGGAACFAFGAAFNSPFLLDLNKVLLAERSQSVCWSGKENGRPHQTSSFCKGATRSLIGAPSLHSEMTNAPAVRSAAEAATEDDSVYVLDKRDGKQGKDILKKLGWLDLMRKAKSLGDGQDVTFPITAAAVAQLATYQELQGTPSLAANSEDFPTGVENLMSRLLMLRGGISRTTLPVDGRRLNTIQRSLQHEVGMLLKSQNLSPSLLSELPRRWEHLGDMAVLPASAFRNPVWQTLGTDLWIILAKALGVCRLGRQAAIATTGTRDSRLQLLLGSSGWVEHRENGILYCFDATKCMFSSGNVSEKLRMASMQCSGEIVVDLFAGIGYYVLPFLLKAGAKHVYACEWNPNALHALRHNLKVNLVEDLCTIIEGDNRVMTLERVASRVCLGLLPSSEGSWEVAVRSLRREGGMLHVHENVKDTEQEERVAYILQSLTSLACSQGLRWQISVSHVERVKWYAPHIRHIVVDVLCTPL